MNTIPQLNISEFDSHRIEFVAQFGAPYQQWGFAGITNNPDASPACLPQCVDQDHPLLYTPTTTDAYLQQRLGEISILN